MATGVCGGQHRLDVADVAVLGVEGAERQDARDGVRRRGRVLHLLAQQAAHKRVEQQVGGGAPVGLIAHEARLERAAVRAKALLARELEVYPTHDPRGALVPDHGALGREPGVEGAAPVPLHRGVEGLVDAAQHQQRRYLPTHSGDQRVNQVFTRLTLRLQQPDQHSLGWKPTCGAALTVSRPPVVVPPLSPERQRCPQPRDAA